MTPSQIENAARRKYNSVSSSFYAEAEIWDLIYQAELEIARETKMLEGRANISGGSVDGTQSYAFPALALEIKRVEYAGQRLELIDFRDDDSMTQFNSNTTGEGTPLYYYLWDRTIYLRPIPDTSSDQIRLYYYELPTIITTSSQVLEVPELFHMCIVDYVVAEMAQKDGNHATAQMYFDKWYSKHLPAMKTWVRKAKTGDRFNQVKDVESLGGPFKL